MKSHPVKPLIVALSTTACAVAVYTQSAFAINDVSEERSIEEITVTADFRAVNILQSPTSVSVINQQQIRDMHAEHMEKLLNATPNVNFARGASRGRFIQIRGIGERSEFVEPTNPSVGVIVDGIDFTGVSTAVTTMDTEQVEILRGPQGTLYGANALAGLINITSNAPTHVFTGGIESSIGNYNTYSTQAYLNTPVSDAVALRFAIQQNSSDGFIENNYLGRDDTNNIDETTFRVKANWVITENLQLDITGFYADIDNGYDAFSLDNNRTTLSDQPGVDQQRTDAGSARLTWNTEGYSIIGLISRANSDLEYSYDEDWAYVGICDGLACEGWEYSSFDDYQRSNDNTTYELRAVSNNADNEINWVAGYYYREQTANLLRIYTYDADFKSQYNTKNQAIYGQLNLPLNENLQLVTGLRFEQRDADYQDSEAAKFSPNEDLWGGKIALQYSLDDNASVYALVSRGYKAGGFNPNNTLQDFQREYGTETMLNYELGHKKYWADGKIFTQASLFYQDRNDVQSKLSNVTCEAGGSPCRFDDFISNAAAGSNWGVELESKAELNSLFSIFGSLGLLQSEYTDFAKDIELKDILDGREQAHAPRYTFSLGSNITFTDALDLRIEVEGKDWFYFSDSHNEKSSRYELLNASLNYTQAQWSLSLWGKNLTDKTYEVRGFGGFGNDPRKLYATEPYYQLGEPRQYGVSGSYKF